MAHIQTPVKGFTGTVIGVDFKDGVGETDDEAALAYFERQGYDITPLAPGKEPAKRAPKKAPAKTPEPGKEPANTDETAD